jgi:hypothetical protein
MAGGHYAWKATQGPVKPFDPAALS